MNREELTTLRDEILSTVQPMVTADSMPIQDRLELVMRLAQVKHDVALYRQAYEMIGNLESEDVKLSQYLQLLDDVEFELTDEVMPETDEDSAEA